MLTGGSTPRAAYELLAGRDEDWSGVTVWLTDDRCVPPEHEHSNFGMLERALLTPLGARAPRVERIEGELGHERAGDLYDAALNRAFGGDTPQLDLILIGLGPDAHICSLFPNDAALGVRDRFAVGVETPGMAPLVSRVTVTLPVVNAGRELLFLVTGADKAGRGPRGRSPGRPTRAPPAASSSRRGARRCSWTRRPRRERNRDRDRREPVPADRRLRLPVRLRDLRAGRAERQRRVDVPAAHGLAERVRRACSTATPACSGSGPTASTSPPPAATCRARWCSRRAGARAAAG